MKKPDFSKITEDIKKSWVIFLSNLIIYCIISLYLNISVKYAILSYLVISCVNLLLENKNHYQPNNYLLSIMLFNPIIEKYGISSLFFIGIFSSIMIYIVIYFKLEEYFTVFPKELYFSLLIISNIFISIISLKYFFGLKSNIYYGNFYQNIISIYKNLKFVDLSEFTVSVVSLGCFAFFSKFNLKNWSIILSTVISVLFCYYFNMHGYHIRNFSENLSFLSHTSVEDSPIFITGFELLSNIKIHVNSIQNISFSAILDYLYSALIWSVIIMTENLIYIKTNYIINQSVIDPHIEARKICLANFCSIILANFPIFSKISSNYTRICEFSYPKISYFFQIICIIFLINYREIIFTYISISTIAALTIANSYSTILAYKLPKIRKFYIIFGIILSFSLLYNMFESYKISLIIGLLLIINRFGKNSVKNLLQNINNEYNSNLEEKIKNATIYKIDNISFLGVISESLSIIDFDKENNNKNNLIIDIINVKFLDDEALLTLIDMISVQIKYYREIILCANHNILHKLKTEIDLPIRIITITEDINN